MQPMGPPPAPTIREMQQLLEGGNKLLMEFNQQQQIKAQQNQQQIQMRGN